MLKILGSDSDRPHNSSHWELIKKLRVAIKYSQDMKLSDCG